MSPGVSFRLVEMGNPATHAAPMLVELGRLDQGGGTVAQDLVTIEKILALIFPRASSVFACVK